MIVHRFDSDELPFDADTVITVGTFDGVHLGHQAIIRRMKATATSANARVVVVTFDPHPQIVLARPDKEPLQLLTSIEERCEVLSDAGVDMAVVIPFDRAFAATEADVFVRNVVQRIGVKTFFVGHDHNFGRNRGGNEELLQRLGTELDFDVVHVEALAVNDVVISSTRIRQALKSADVEGAASMLGRPYGVLGTVIHGDARGRTIGYPTANVQPADTNKLLPANGVYVVSAVIDGNVVYGMANVGTRPTFTDSHESTLEVHFLDTDADLYGATLTVHFHSHLRPEYKFASVEELVEHIENDEQRTRNIINNTFSSES